MKKIIVTVLMFVALCANEHQAIEKAALGKWLHLDGATSFQVLHGEAFYCFMASEPPSTDMCYRVHAVEVVFPQSGDTTWIRGVGQKVEVRWTK